MRRLELQEQLQQIDGDGAVERRGRLIEHQQFRLQDQRARNRNALALAAGKFGRIAKARLGIEADFAERVDGAPVALLRGEFRRMNAQALRDDLADSHPRRRARHKDSERRAASSRRSGRISARVSGVRLRPSKLMRPEAGTSFKSARPSVDFPDPDSPTSPSVRPWRNVSAHIIDRLDLLLLLEQPAAQTKGDSDVFALRAARADRALCDRRAAAAKRR